MPTPSDLHVDSMLTDLSVAFVQDPMGFVADRVAPSIPVNKQSDIIPQYNRDDFFRTQVQRRAPKSKAARADYTVSSTMTYHCDVWALETAVDDQERANADLPFRPDEDAVSFLTQQMLIRREKQWVTNFFSTGIWTQVSVGTQWDDVASSPLEDIERQKRTIGDNTGFEANTLVLGRQVWSALKNHPDIVDRIKHTSSDPVAQSLVARLCELDNIFVGKGVEVTSQEGTTADTYARLHGRHALLCYVPARPGLMTPSAMYTFKWNGLTGSQDGQRILRYREEPHNDVIEIEAAWDQKVIATPLARFFTSVVSTAA